MSVIDDYLVAIPKSQREVLERIRSTVKKLVPEATDTIGYGMPVMKLNGKYLIGFSSFKDHMSIFPRANPVASTKTKLKAYKTSKGTIQFTTDNPLPDELLQEIIVECLKNIPNS
jgi:uncharacterized protein YdhG (YjbR/CyaY superfamily)